MTGSLNRLAAAALPFLLVAFGACSNGGDQIVPPDAVSCQADTDCQTDNPCQAGACVEGFCQFSPVEAACDDGDPCTEGDQCTDGTCGGTPLKCDDGQACNGSEKCDPQTGQCLAGTPPDMDDGIACTVDQCDEDKDDITHTPDNALCDDQNPCTDDVCDVFEAGCIYSNNVASCDDTNPCTINDQCALGKCQGEDKSCDDGLFCNGTESCDPANGDCLAGTEPDLSDGVDCTADACDEDKDSVVHTPDDTACDDSNPCTEETCSSVNGCQFVNTDALCDDLDACTQGDVCADGICQPGAWICFEDCDNGADDDTDELVDCEDPDCQFDLACMPDGETCETAYTLNQGKPLVLGGVVDFSATTAGMSDDLSGSCAEDSLGSPDAVHTLILGEAVGLITSVDFAGDGWPAVYILGESCEDELFCKVANSTEALQAVTVLPAGIYNIVLDGGFAGDAGDYSIHIETFAPAAKETACNNGIDDDGDTFLDCADKDCLASPLCAKAAGESCADPYELFTGPVIDQGEVVSATYKGNTAPMKKDLSGSCDAADTKASPDMVFSFTLTDPMWLDASHDYEGLVYPAFYLLDSGCAAGKELACTTSGEEPAAISLPLGAGTYFLVVDGSYPGDSGPFTLSVELTPLADTETECTNNLDDDQDGAKDCDDDDCAQHPTCVGFPGDNCKQAFPVNEGQPIMGDLIGKKLKFEGTTEGMGAHYSASCDAETAKCPDVVYKFTLASPLDLTFTFDFLNTAYPAMYLLGADCDTKNTIACVSGFSSAISIKKKLPVGTYYVVLDGAAVGLAPKFEPDKGPYVFTMEFAPPPDMEVNCTNGIDDDVDGAPDCEDLDCKTELICSDPYEPNNTLDKAFDMGDIGDVGFQAAWGTMLYPEGDEDWYRFVVSAPRFLTATADPNLVLDLKATLFDSTGTPLVVADQAPVGAAEIVEFGLVDVGEYYFQVKGFQQSTGEYSLLLELLPPPQSETDCNNQADDDLDGQPDCNDSDCDSSPICGGGDTCQTAIEVNGGQPAGPELYGQTLSYTGSTVGNADDFSGSCSTASADSPDSVFKLVLAAEMKVDVKLTYDSQKWPALYILQGACAGAEVGCAAAKAEPAKLQAVLGAGTWYVVLDGNWAGDAAAYSIDFTFGPTWVEGDDCSHPFKANEGIPISKADDGLSLTYNGDTSGLSDSLAGSCSEGSGDSPDAVWSFTLTDYMDVTITHDFDSFFFPALYLFKDSCGTPEIDCITAKGDAALLDVVLEPGTWYVVLDGDFPGDAGAYTLTLTFIEHVFVESDCQNGQDDDFDTLVDCLDDECAAEPACLGETCVAALPVNDGIPITKADDGLEATYKGDSTGMGNEYAGSCSAATALSPDAVYRLDLADPMNVSASLDFDGIFYPAVTVFAGDCKPAAEIACAKGTSGPAQAKNLVLKPGTYFVVVDGSFEGDAAPYTLILSFHKLPVSETDCTNGIDDDGDGFADCCDKECAATPACTEKNCGDGLDDDCDMLVDCDDDQCLASGFCMVLPLPYDQIFEYGGNWPDGFLVQGPDKACQWKPLAGGSGGLGFGMKMSWGLCSTDVSYDLLSPELDVSWCDEITVSFSQKGAFLAWLLWHGVGIDDGVTTAVQDATPPETFWASSGSYLFDVSTFEKVRVFLAYKGSEADDWWIDDLSVHCSKVKNP